MVYVNISNNVEKISNRFDLVLVASNKAKIMQKENREKFLLNKTDKCTVIALREIEKYLIKHLI